MSGVKKQLSKLATAAKNSKAGGVVKQLSSQAMPVVDANFIAVMWIMLIWLLVVWFCPMLLHATDAMWPDRVGPYVNLMHVRLTFNLADGLFIFLCVIGSAMILVVSLVSGLYIRDACKHKDDVFSKYNNGKGVPVTRRPAFRLFWIVLGAVLMIFINVATIIDVACVDNSYIEQAALDLKFMHTDPESVARMRMVAKKIYQYGYGGMENVPDGASGKDLFLTDGLLVHHGSAGVLHIIPQSTLKEFQIKNALMLDGVAATAADLDKLMAANTLVKAEITNAKIALTSPKPIITEGDVNGVHMAVTDDALAEVHLAGLGISAHDLLKHDSSMHVLLEHYGHGANSQDKLKHLMVAANSSNTQGISLAYLTMSHNSVVRPMLSAEHNGNSLNLDKVIDGVHYCETGKDYAAVLYVTFNGGLILGLTIMLIVRRINKKHRRHPNGYKSLPTTVNSMAGDVARNFANTDIGRLMMAETGVDIVQEDAVPLSSAPYEDSFDDDDD